MTTHVYIPDTQVKPGIPLDHLDWIGAYLIEKKYDKVIVAGDWYDLPSMSAWDKGKKAFEGRRYKADVQAGHDALERMWAPIEAANERVRGYKGKQYLPERHVTWGNHEHRADRCSENSAELDGMVGTFEFTDFWKARGWNCHAFKEVLELDGIWYSHFFYNPMTGKPWGGMIENRLQKIGNSFTQGHTQTLMHGIRYVGNRQQHGLVAGACYLHDEDYKGPQGNHHWRGIVVKHEVRGGAYDPMFVSLDYLCRRYEQMSLPKFMAEKYGVAA